LADPTPGVDDNGPRRVRRIPIKPVWLSGSASFSMAHSHEGTTLTVRPFNREWGFTLFVAILSGVSGLSFPMGMGWAGLLLFGVLVPFFIMLGLEHELTLTSQAVRIRTYSTEVSLRPLARREWTFPLMSLEHAELASYFGLWQVVVLKHKDGTKTGVKLGNADDMAAIAAWMNQHIAKAQRAPAEPIPVPESLKRLCREAVKRPERSL